MTGYTKLFGSILDSTVWLESTPTKVVWITMLAMADRDGCVEASVPGLAKRAGVTREECEGALSLFLSPDEDSRTQDYEGRRIVVVDGGWRLLNYDVYRERASAEEAREKAAARKRRQRERAESRKVTLVTPSHPIAEAEAPAKAEATPTTKERSSPLVVSPLQYDKLKQTHAFVGSRLRVPNVLHTELRTKLGGDGETRLQAWYQTVNDQAELTGEAIPDVFTWLRPRFVGWCEAQGYVKAPGPQKQSKAEILAGVQALQDAKAARR